MAIYHLSASKGSRSRGQSAAAKSDYINREGKYKRDGDELAVSGFGNMPGWAGKPREYWAAADLHERANGRLFRHYEAALPRELPLEQITELAGELVKEISQTPEGPLPYSWAIHRGKGENPHIHLMVSERVQDGYDRTAETWFKRAWPAHRAEGGAVKVESLERKERLLELRERWADMTNAVLSRAGSASRIDHRSLEAQGIDRQPQAKLGQYAAVLERQGTRSRRGEINRLRASTDAEEALLKTAGVKTAKEAEKKLEQAEWQAWQAARALADVENLVKDHNNEANNLPFWKKAWLPTINAFNKRAQELELTRRECLEAQERQKTLVADLEKAKIILEAREAPAREAASRAAQTARQKRIEELERDRARWKEQAEKNRLRLRGRDGRDDDGR
jgi:hypothetical protein